MRSHAMRLNIRDGFVKKHPISLVELEDGALSAVASLDIFFNPSEWTQIKVLALNWLPASANQSIIIRTSTDGSTFDNTANDYRYAHVIVDDVPAVTAGGSTTPTGIVASPQAGGGADQTADLEATLFDPSSTSFKKIDYTASAITSSPNLIMHKGWGIRWTSADVNGVQLRFNSGNITSGRYKVLGVRA